MSSSKSLIPKHFHGLYKRLEYAMLIENSEEQATSWSIQLLFMLT